ncbi:MAG: SDR family oxidoreductase [Clostridiales bacterium]|nr:SDR family oxidoreductase [Clostridiales bacterium]
MSELLKGKTAIVTGGGTGIGTAVATRFAAEGAKVLITGRRESLLAEVQNRLPEGSVHIFAGDVVHDAEAMAAAALTISGRIDILVNNAAVDPEGTVLDMPEEEWRKAIEINLTGPFLMMKAVLPHMIEAGKGVIINMSSLAGLRCIPSMAAYSSSKAGLIGLTRATAFDFGKYGVRVNAICPGPVKTEAMDRAMRPLAAELGIDIDGAYDQLAAFLPLGRSADASEIAGTALFLASDDASFITGAVISADGGATIVDPCGPALGPDGNVSGDH